MKVDSPMIATAKLCKKFYPKHKTVFISPCNFKKLEAIDCIFVDYVIDYKQLKVLLESKGLNEKFCSAKECPDFDLFYNNYTKIYPLAGGLSKTAHLKGVLKRGEEKIIDGISEVEGFLKNPSKNIRFLDANFCKGGCIGGPFLNRGTLADRKKRILDYLKLSNKEKLSPSKKGNILRAKGISFSIK